MNGSERPFDDSHLKEKHTKSPVLLQAGLSKSWHWKVFLFKLALACGEYCRLCFPTLGGLGDLGNLDFVQVFSSSSNSIRKL